MEENKNNNKTKIRKTGFSIRTTETFLNILKKVSTKKEMSMTETIENLVRIEADKLKIK